MPHQDVFRALADPTRRAILRTLADGSRSAGELADQFPISRASLSHHFSVLKAADLVRTRRYGQSIIYSVNTTLVEDLTRAILDIFEGDVMARNVKVKR
jgi:ArsR family transcriptional regulator, arsenate/arsenite/antimonite-responsive transcriptional repressor